MSTDPAAVRHGERGAAFVTAILVSALLLVLAMALLTVSSDEGGIAANESWAEGAFYAAEAGVHAAVAQIDGNLATSVAAIPVTHLPGGYTFRSGRRADTAPQPVRYVGAVPASGFGLGVGTGYNAVGFLDETYEVDATGRGPRNAEREIQAQVTYGPVAR
jgi:hypothetical protein